MDRAGGAGLTTKVRRGNRFWAKLNLDKKKRIEEETTIKLNTWASRTISGCLEARVGGNKATLGNLAPTRDIVRWQINRTMVHWGLYPLGIKYEPW